MRLFIIISAFMSFSAVAMSAADAACQRVPQCRTYTQYVNQPYQQNICSYYGRQRSCYVATRYRQVPVTRQQCTYQTYCSGGFNGMMKQVGRRY